MVLPFENNTNAIVNKLAKRNMQSEKRRNLMVIVAVALSAFLICFSGTMGTSMLQIQKNQINDTYEATYVGITEQNIQTLRTIPELARVGKYYIIGSENSSQGFNALFSYGDTDAIYIARNQMKLQTGNLPESENEIVVSSGWISKYSPGTEVGGTIRLDTESFHGEYIVSGIMDALTNETSETYSFLVSKESLTKWDGYDDSMYIAYCHLENDKQLDADTIQSFYQQVAKENNLPEPRFNTVYFRWAGNDTVFGALPLALITAGIVLVGGYIVIQSIFRISINDKIQSYGQLRTIGATQKQIKRFVKKEGHQLGGIGILIGIVLGVICSLIIFFDGFNALYYAGIVFLTVFVCCIMVSFAIRKPIKIAAKISPIEAVRFTSEQKRISHSRKKHVKLNPSSLGLMNFDRDRKKTISIILSLSLGGLLLLIISSVSLLQSPERMARQQLSYGDYKIYIDSEKSQTDILRAGNPLSEELKQEVLAIDGVENIVVTRQSAHAQFSTGENSSSGVCDMITDGNYSNLEDSLIDGTMPTKGHNVVIAVSVAETEHIEVGSTLELSFGETIIPVKVTGTFDPSGTIMADGIGHSALSLDSAILFAPKELFQELLPGIENFDYSWSIVSDPEKDQIVKDGLKSIVSNHTDISLDQMASLVESFEQTNMIYEVLKIVSWMVFLFGVVNLINTTLANQISRKRENSILRSIGLTQKQLYKMIVCEEIGYVLFVMTTILIIGLPITIFACREISKIIYAGEVIAYQFPLFEMGLFIFVLFGLEFILSFWTICRQKKQSLIEQMRTME